MQPLPLARFDRVSAAFGDRLVFSDLSLSLYAGEHLALLGPNGAGKSTFMRLLQGDLRPARIVPGRADAPPGRIIFGFDGVEDSSVLAAREHVRTVSPALQRNYVRQGWKITGEEILLSGLGNAAMVYGELSSSHYRRAAALAESVEAAPLLSMLAPAMSQGQLRLALILRALMSRPALLLLDEPFDGLDGPAREHVNRAVVLAMERGTVLVSAHRRTDIPAGIHDALLLECDPEKGGSVRRVPLDGADAMKKTVTDGGSAALAVGPGVLCTTDAHAPCRDNGLFLSPPDAPPLLQLEHVDVFIDRKRVLTDICWTVKPGEQWIVSGRNGSGKSTLLRLLYGEEFAAWGGTVAWRGKPRPALDELRRQVGYVSDRLQDVYDYDLSAEDVVVSGFSGSIGLYGEPSQAERTLARLWLERMGLRDTAGAGFHSLSSGTMRRVLLARALAGSPPVLLLDEPLSGLDEAGRRLFLDALPELAAGGVHIIYVSHHEDDKSDLFTHELRLEQGRVACAGSRHS